MSRIAGTVTGLLLAGGQSQRMGGGDKGLLDLGGRPMIAHVIERLKPQVGPIAINANGDPARYAAFGLPVIADTVEGFAGPLAGLLAGFAWTAAVAPDAAYMASVPADVPFVPPDLVMRLSSAGAEAPDSVVLAASAGTVHPVIGLWPVALAADLEAAIDAGMRKVHAWTARHRPIVIEFPALVRNGRRIDPFFNANTPEELETARALLEES